jgi:hypothetical protein
MDHGSSLGFGSPLVVDVDVDSGGEGHSCRRVISLIPSETCFRPVREAGYEPNTVTRLQYPCSRPSFDASCIERGATPGDPSDNHTLAKERASRLRKGTGRMKSHDRGEIIIWTAGWWQTNDKVKTYGNRERTAPSHHSACHRQTSDT